MGGLPFSIHDDGLSSTVSCYQNGTIQKLRRETIPHQQFVSNILTSLFLALCYACPISIEERAVDTIEPGKTFVRFMPEGRFGQTFLSVVLGELEKNGATLCICPITEHKPMEVPRRMCEVVPAPTIEIDGLINLIAREPEFGVGMVVSQIRIDEMLYLNIARGGESSGLVPITNVTFCYPSSGLT